MQYSKVAASILINTGVGTATGWQIPVLVTYLKEKVIDQLKYFKHLRWDERRPGDIFLRNRKLDHYVHAMFDEVKITYSKPDKWTKKHKFLKWG